MNRCDTTFRSMGSDVRLIVEGRDPERDVERERAFVEAYARALTRFDAGSELSALNADERELVPVSPLLRAAVAAGLWAAERTDGLVDPTLLSELERAGYSHSLAGATAAPLAEALLDAPRRQPARPHPDARWRTVAIEGAAVRRPPGVRIDTGGTGKGLCADAVARRLRGNRRFVVDCGGDIAVGGSAGVFRPYEIEVRHPLTGASVHTLTVGAGGVATSGLDVRIWRRADGSFAHHLLDPSTGEPAWTGLVGATALGGSALEAETLSKHALLLGPAGAREVLAERGGVIFHDDGHHELVGPANGRPRLRVAVAA